MQSAVQRIPDVFIDWDLTTTSIGQLDVDVILRYALFSNEHTTFQCNYIKHLTESLSYIQTPPESYVSKLSTKL
ncbi:hypothetical protein ACTXT7_016674 [Hymenolepis weldensis]